MWQRAPVFILLLMPFGCIEEELPPFELSVTFRGEACGGRDLLSRQRVTSYEYEIYSSAELSKHRLHQGSVPCTDEPLVIDLAPGEYRVVVRGYGDDGKLCWDTGERGAELEAFESRSGSVAVPAVCLLDDAVRLSVEVSGPGDVIAEPYGVDCPALSCVAIYDRYVGVRLTARPREGSAFLGWSTNCGNTSPVVTLAMIADRTCVATFGGVSGTSSWSVPHGVPGLSFGRSWEPAAEARGPLVFHARADGSVGVSRAASVPAATGDWQTSTAWEPAGRTQVSHSAAVDANDGTFLAVPFEGEAGCGIDLLSRPSSDSRFALSTIATASAPCRADRGRSLAALGDGSLVLAATDPDEHAVVVRLIDGSEPTGLVLFEALPRAIRQVSRIVSANGLPAFAFSVFNRDLSQGEIWVAAAIRPHPAARADWSVHPVFVSQRIAESPDITVDNNRLAVTFATIEGLARPSEMRSQHVALARHDQPRLGGDWIVATVDPERGGPASIVRFGSQLAIAYGHTDAATGRSSILVAAALEATPLKPEDWSIDEIDEPLLPAQPRLMTVGRKLAILYSQGPAQPLIFRATDSL